MDIPTATTPSASTQAGGSVRTTRNFDALRDVHFEPEFLRNADASTLVSFGSTRVLCAASVQAGVPRWMEGRGEGWVTAEYAMLPASTGGGRKRRDGIKRDGRSVEIQRLIGRSLRAVVDRAALGEFTVTIDCDVLDADGGTRCASICGGYVALHRALAKLIANGTLATLPLTDSVAAVSVGIVAAEMLVDLEYIEDSRADVDMNVVTTGAGKLIEVQASAEGATYSRAEFDGLLDLATNACAQIRTLQQAACKL